MKISLTLVLALILGTSAEAAPIPISAYNQKPKLILTLVVDQLRPDMLTLNQKSFLPAAAKNGEVGGYNFLISNGAFFPLTSYKILQSMTCPGHAMILSGSYPQQMKIPLNEWFDRKSGKMLYCVEDNSVEVLGSKDMTGMSPKNFQGSTLTDEIKNAGLKNKTFAVAIKDRGAILLGGPQADLAVWFSPKEMKWVTSSFYQKDKIPPVWLSNENSKIQTKSEVYGPYGNELTVDMAIRGFRELKLGLGAGTDVLAVSFSSHDYTGHRFGPNSKQVFEITVHEDKSIARLLNAIKKTLPGGLKDVLVVLTSDHGVAPDTEFLSKKNLPSGLIDQKQLAEKINVALEKQFGSKGEGAWVQAVKSFNFYLNYNKVTASGKSLAEIEAAIVPWLSLEPGVSEVLTGSQLRAGKKIPGLMGEQLANTYDSQIHGDLILVPRPFFYEKGNFATHMTGYSYDSQVPLILSGRNIKKGVYPQSANIVDIGPTLSFILGIAPPALSEGRVLHEIF